MKNLQTIVKEAGYSVDFDNRNRACKSINKVLSSSDITIELIKKGFVRVTKNGFKYNLIIRLGKTNRVYHINDTDPYTILIKLALFLKVDEVRKIIHSTVSEKHTCPKCGGTGFLPHFAHYAKGVCFDCMGVGVVGELSVIDIQKMKDIEAKRLKEEQEIATYKEGLTISEISLKPFKEKETNEELVEIFSKLNTTEIKEKILNGLAKVRNEDAEWGAWIGVKENIFVSGKEMRGFNENFHYFIERDENGKKIFYLNTHNPLCTTSNGTKVFAQIELLDFDGQDIFSVNFYRKNK